MIDEQHTLNQAFNTQLSRRHLLQLLGLGGAGVLGLDLLAACGGPTPSVTITPTPQATVTTNLEPTRPLTPYFLGYNNLVPLRGSSWQDPNIVKAAQELKLENIRYPGGTVANFWDWQTGWFVPNARPGLLSIKPTPYRLQDLQIAVQATGATPIYVLNMITSNLNYQLEMLRTAKSMGLPVKLVELGNEFYLDAPENLETFPTSQAYGKTCTTWIAAIRKEFPDVKISAVAAVPSSESVRVRNDWNQGLFQTLHGADALTLHPYVQIKKGFIPNNVPNTGPDATTTAEKVISAIFQKWQDVQDVLHSMPGNMEVWYTEYNLNGSTANIIHRWVHGMCAASITLTYLEDEHTTLECFYEMAAKSGYEAVYYDRNSGGNNKTGLAQYSLTAIGYVMRLLADTLSGMTSTQKMNFSPNPLLQADMPSSTSLQGWLFTDGIRKQAFILNRSANSFSWKGDSLFSTGTNFQQMTSDPFKLITGPDSFIMNSGTLHGSLVLPPFSVTQLKAG